MGYLALPVTIWLLKLRSDLHSLPHALIGQRPQTYCTKSLKTMLSVKCTNICSPRHPPVCCLEKVLHLRSSSGRGTRPWNEPKRGILQDRTFRFQELRLSDSRQVESSSRSYSCGRRFWRFPPEFQPTIPTLTLSGRARGFYCFS
jgi:hypothetical protein